MRLLFLMESQCSRGMNQSDGESTKKMPSRLCLRGRVGLCNAHSSSLDVMPSTSIITSSCIRGTSTVVVPHGQELPGAVVVAPVQWIRWVCHVVLVPNHCCSRGLPSVFVVGCNVMAVIVVILLTMMMPRCNYCS
jgi:hypothetical protein